MSKRLRSQDPIPLSDAVRVLRAQLDAEKNLSVHVANYTAALEELTSGLADQVNRALQLGDVIAAGTDGKVTRARLHSALGRDFDVAVKTAHDFDGEYSITYEYALMVALEEALRGVPLFVRPVALFKCPTRAMERPPVGGMLSVVHENPRTAPVRSFLVMEMVKPGTTLWSEAVDMTPVEMASTLALVAYGLERAQQRAGFVHADLGAGNVIFRDLSLTGGGTHVGVHVNYDDAEYTLPLYRGTYLPTIIDLSRSRVDESAWQSSVAPSAFRAEAMDKIRETFDAVPSNKHVDQQYDLANLVLSCWTSFKQSEGALGPGAEETKRMLEDILAKLLPLSYVMRARINPQGNWTIVDVTDVPGLYQPGFFTRLLSRARRPFKPFGWFMNAASAHLPKPLPDGYIVYGI